MIAAGKKPAIPRQEGVVLDTNLLLLLWVGRWNSEAIPQHKCTNQFDKDDYWRLEDFLSRFRKVAVTPSILTEGSNLIRQSKHRQDITTKLVEQIPLFDEHYFPSVDVVQSAAFIPLGLTDAGIVLLARDQWLVLTTDVDLFLRLTSDELPVVNFNHLRSLDQ
jgi:hypothetical protein